MAQAYFFTSTAVQTQLNVGISNSATSAQVASTVGWPTQYPYVIAIDYGGTTEELCTVTANNLGNLTITRGFDNTSAQTHGVGAVVRHVYCGNDANTAYVHIGSTAGVHGVTGNVVGDVDIQTLTNKTLTSPVLNTPAITGGSITGTITGAAPVFTMNPLLIQPTAAANLPFVIRGLSGQAGDLAAVQDNLLNRLWTIHADGSTVVTPSGTTSGERYLQVNVPSGANNNSSLLNLQKNGTTAFDVAPLGTTNITVGSTSADGYTIDSPAAYTGKLLNLRNQAATVLSVDLNGVITTFGGISSQGNIAVTGGTLSASSTVTGSNLTATASYTPTLSGGALTLGNGTVAGSFARSGGLLSVQVLITCGTTTTLAASGNLTISLPGPVPAAIGIGTSYFTKTSGGSFNLASAVAAVGATTASYFTTPAGLMNAFNTTNSAAVASGSVIVMNIAYLV